LRAAGVHTCFLLVSSAPLTRRKAHIAGIAFQHDIIIIGNAVIGCIGKKRTTCDTLCIHFYAIFTGSSIMFTTEAPRHPPQWFVKVSYWNHVSRVFW
jgi:hypothetical protein